MVLLVLLTVFLMIVMAFGLWLSKNAAEKERQKRETRAKIRKIDQFISEIEEVIQTLEGYDGNPALLSLIASFLIAQLETKLRLDPDSATIPQEIANARAYINELPAREDLGRLEAANDRQISLLKRHTAKTAKLLRHVCSARMASESEIQSHIHRLKHNNLQHEVRAYLHQGDVCRENQDNMSAASYYKHAKEILVASSLSYDGKSEEIKRISKQISGLYTSLGGKRSDDEDI